MEYIITFNIFVLIPLSLSYLSLFLLIGFSYYRSYFPAFFFFFAYMLLLLLSRFSHVWLCVRHVPIDGSPPGSPVPGILQARTLEWVAISFSNAWKWKVKVKSLRRVQLLATSCMVIVYWMPDILNLLDTEYSKISLSTFELYLFWDTFKLFRTSLILLRLF